MLVAVAAQGLLAVTLMAVLQFVAEMAEMGCSLTSAARQRIMVGAEVVRARDIMAAMADKAEVVKAIPAFMRLAKLWHDQARQTLVVVEAAALQVNLLVRVALASL